MRRRLVAIMCQHSARAAHQLLAQLVHQHSGAVVGLLLARAARLRLCLIPVARRHSAAEGAYLEQAVHHRLAPAARLRHRLAPAPTRPRLVQQRLQILLAEAPPRRRSAPLPRQVQLALHLVFLAEVQPLGQLHLAAAPQRLVLARQATRAEAARSAWVLPARVVRAVAWLPAARAGSDGLCLGCS